MIELLTIVIIGLSSWFYPAETKPETSCIETAVEIGAVAVSSTDGQLPRPKKRSCKAHVDQL